MRISDLFRQDVNRRIEEVVKVDLDDDPVIVEELDEYVATDHILEAFEMVLDAYWESINDPSETCTVWVSGFFGSGKSSWAKVLGYLLGNPAVQGRLAADRFFERTHAPPLQALLNTIHSQSPTMSVLLNLATGSNVVAREGESVVLPVYRALLERLDYSRNFTLAELEYTLEGDGKLEEFESAFEEIVGEPWRDRRYTVLAKRQAVEALDAIFGSASGLPGWASELDAPDIDADWFAARALELMQRRGEGVDRLVFVVDEVGQYVARSVQRMLDLQGLAETFQKRRGRLWLVVTSQERLGDVVDSLESRQIELARAQARFPLRVDMLPSDIDEVTSRRILDKNGDGERTVREAVSPHRNQLITNIRLSSPTRSEVPGEDQLVRLYPLLPYQIQLLIDAVSARRAQGGSSPTVGGSNRTLIKHAQQLIAHPEHGLGPREVGALVTIDLSYELLEELIPTSWRAEIEQVAEQHGADSVEAKVMKVVALCAEVPALPLTPHNLAVLLHPGLASESQRDPVAAALARLVREDRLRESDGGYRLQSPEQKDWERTRRGIGLTQGPSIRLRRSLLKQVLTGLAVSRGRTFRADVTVDGERIHVGDLALHIDEADELRREVLRGESRESANSNTVTWVYELSDDTWDALEELHRSRTMIERADVPNKTATDVELIGEERERERRHEDTSLRRLARDLAAGQALFRGRIDDVEGSDLRPTALRLLDDRLDDIYPRLAEFNADLRREEIMHVLRTADLATLPESLRSDGIGLVAATPDGYRIVTDHGPLSALVDEIRARASYGHEATGSHLETHFAAPPFGAPVEVVQALCAAGLRAGVLQVVHQGQRISHAGDARADQAFGTLPRFRAAAFEPPADTDVSLEVRVALAERLEHAGQLLPGHSTGALAAAVRVMFGAEREAAVRVAAALEGLGIDVPHPVIRTRQLIDRLADGDDIETVTTAHNTWADLIDGCDATNRLDRLVSDHLDELRAAQQEASRSAQGLSDELQVLHAELVELLAGGDLVAHAARITALARQLIEARQAAAGEAAQRLVRAIEGHRDRLRRDFGDLESSAVDEALRPLIQLTPAEDLHGADAAALASQIDSAQARAAEARRRLDELRSEGRLAWVRAGEFVTEPITTEEEIDPALDRLREAIASELADGRQVRLQ